MWKNGSGVMESLFAMTYRAKTAFVEVPLPDVEEVEIREQTAFGLAGRARGVEQGAFARPARPFSARGRSSRLCAVSGPQDASLCASTYSSSAAR